MIDYDIPFPFLSLFSHHIIVGRQQRDRQESAASEATQDGSSSLLSGDFQISIL